MMNALCTGNQVKVRIQISSNQVVVYLNGNTTIFSTANVTDSKQQAALQYILKNYVTNLTAPYFAIWLSSQASIQVNEQFQILELLITSPSGKVLLDDLDMTAIDYPAPSFNTFSFRPFFLTYSDLIYSHFLSTNYDETCINKNTKSSVT